MKCITLIALLFACSAASFLSAKTEKAVMNQLNRMWNHDSGVTPATNLYEEDVKFCGTYESECIPDDMLSMKDNVKVLGMMHKNPIYMQFPNAFYLGETCSEENLFSKVTMNASLKAKDGIDKKMEIVAEKVTLLFANEQGIAAYTCSEPLELNKEYDVTTLDCKDAQGEDPFADMKAMIGKTQEGDMTFGEDYLEVKDEQGTSTRFTRESDMGCTCAKSSLRDAF
mgnify:CR=1 FL=1